MADFSPLEEILPSDFQRFVAVEQRFTGLQMTGKEAFESDQLLDSLKEVIEVYEDEFPF